MGVDVRIIIAATVICAATPVLSQAVRCAYMTNIPREERPHDLPVIEYEGLTWQERPLLPADEEREDVCFDQFQFMTSGNEAVQAIFVDEEREGDVAIAKLNYNGTNVPIINPAFMTGSFNNLGPELRQIDGVWYLYTTVRQDYEVGREMQQYFFTLSIPGETLIAHINLEIVNIDDNLPILVVLDPCQVSELGEGRLTDCVYTVTDADGRISTEFMRFVINSDRGDDEIFYIVGSNLPNNEWFTMHMTVGIRSPLNFQENPLHIFSVTAFDSLPNNRTATLMVQVENVEHRPPRWVEIFAVQQFDEKTKRDFPVRAIDGDTGIDKPIYYRIETEPEDTFFRIETIEGGRSGAIFYVDEIDRDTLEREVFQLNIIAYKYDNESFATVAPVVIIVNDVNDNMPVPIHTNYTIEIDEETPMTLNLEEFGFHDRDLGPNAQYSVHLEAVSPPGAELAFYIAPQVGYQRQEFIMGTTNHSMLDFEDPPFQHIVLKVVATELHETSHVGHAMLYINLTNWNDEVPIFENGDITVSFNETEGQGYHVGNMKALDRDIDDRVEHSLMGNVGDILWIDEETGDIFVLKNDSFDYHRQNVYFVQVRADDTLGEPYHTTTSQLVIELLDINNTPPTLRLPRGSPQVNENEPDGFQITTENSAITATDPDTTADLHFEIDWDTSWATKQGREADSREYHNCVYIETSYPNEDNHGVVTGHLVVREIRPNVTIDFEMFEILYLTIRVKDRNTYIGDDYDEATFAVTIIDRNDNPPVWENGTLEQAFMVREMSNQGVIIGSVLATDIDGPLYNQVRYTISPRDDTPDDLVAIDFISGQITVETSQAIDADTPPRFYLYYTVLATDRCTEPDPDDCPPDPHYHNTYGDIEIFITDINNKVPEPDYDSFETTVYIYENATTGDDVTYIVASDKDRDEIYHTIGYQINYAVNPRLLDFFMVDRDTGLLYVNLTGNDVLDRDGDEPEHRIFFNLIDNFLGEGDGNRNQNTTEIVVVLLDVNDNAPELPDPSQHIWVTSEDLDADISIEPVLHAPDRDEPGTVNSLVGFNIVDLTITNRDIDVPDLFVIESIDTDKGVLISMMPLKGYWGTYDIHIHAYDHGHPQQHSNETYTLIVHPYNYHAPVFVFPTHGSVIRFTRERAVQNSLLVTLDQEFLRQIEATDEDGLEAGQVTFSVTGNDEAVEYFDINTNPAEENQASLILQHTITDTIRDFQITIRATDGGTNPGPLWTEISFEAVFVPTSGDPVFENNTATVAFIEKEEGMLESHTLEPANDLKNYRCDNDCHDIYYRIIDGNSDGHFVLDATTNTLTLATELDRSVNPEYTLVIAASNSLTGVNPLPSSLLSVTVTVREADPRPVFHSELYTAGIYTLGHFNNDLLTVQATHSEGLPIEYHINETSMVADPSLDAVRDSAFALNPTTGLLSVTMSPTPLMHGNFEFQVVAVATDGSTDTATVIIYLVSLNNQVIFTFENTIDEVLENEDFIAETFTDGFGMRCNIDEVVPASSSEGVQLDDKTDVRSHFIRDGEPVLASEIELLRSNTELLNDIRLTLRTRQLRLDDFYTGVTPPVTRDPNEITIYVLAALAALLAFLCLVLLLTFIIRTRALNRRLEALSVTKYGSQDSGLNRVGIMAPGTNKFAAEGSNPMWNLTTRAPDFDAISDISNDSDFIGIEDLPQFRNDYFPGDSNSLQHIIPDDERNAVPNHSNNFGFNSSPFSPGFANSQLRR